MLCYMPHTTCMFAMLCQILCWLCYVIYNTILAIIYQMVCYLCQLPTYAIQHTMLFTEFLKCQSKYDTEFTNVKLVTNEIITTISY